jgi:C4-dicarboxylate-specific signal transduction histidine kinase
MNHIYHPTEKKRLTGVLTLGYDLDDDFFHSLQAMTGTPVLLVSQTRVIASSFETDSPTEFGPGPQHQTIGPFTYDLSPIPIRQDLGESLDLVVAVNTEQTRSTLYWVMLVTPILFFLFWRERTTSEFRQTKNMQGAVEEVQAQVSDAEQAANASKRARVSAQAQLASTQQFLIRAQRLSIIGEQLSSVSQDIYGSLQSILKVQKEQRTQTSKSLQTLNRLGLGGDDARDLEGSLRDLENGIYENQLMGRRIWDLVSAIMSQSATERTATNGIHLEPLITQALTIFRGRTKLHKITTDYLDPPLFGGKAADIGLVITNLLDNAIDAVDERAQNELRYGRAFEGRIHVHASRAVRHEELGLRVVITDNGPGIAEDDIEKIFEPFFSNKPAGSCLGLGLTISQGIIEEHCGTLIASRDAALGGARFDMWIPDTWQGSSTG